MARLLFTGRDFGSLADPIDSSNSRKLNTLIALPVVFMYQSHGNDVAVIENESIFPEADAIITTNKNIALAVRVADCLPLLLASQNVVAAVHVGRKGLMNQVALKAVSVMKQLGAVQINGVVGPHICGDCYEVDSQTYAEVRSTYPATGQKKNYLNLYKGLEEQLGDIRLENLKLCTKENSKYFSHRANSEAGRQVGVISL
ncbi:MAG: polyphenol oxidase family protein [Candidatus Nanopelagicus sp.]